MYAELADLQRKLATVMNGQRVFLVLDDVWNERRDQGVVLCSYDSCKGLPDHSYHSERGSGKADTDYAFLSPKLFKVDDIPINLIKIGKSIVIKCKGLPLAIKTLGSMLRYENDQRRWMNVLESELWDLKEPRDEILVALELSYKHMPLDSCDDSYLLHDLIHDLACFFAEEEFYRTEGDTSAEIPQNVRYLSINKAITSADISVFPHSIRVIRVMSFDDKHETILPESLFSTSNKLRVLGNPALVLHDCVGSLKLLRHLIMDRYYGSSTWTLHMQNLVLSGVGQLTRTRLHTFPQMRIGHHCSFNIRELRNINQIRELSISGLNKIYHVEDAIEAQLQSKKHLRSLSLWFDEDEDECLCGLRPEHMNVTTPPDQLLLRDSLRPHQNIRELGIFRYNSGEYP
ncbi:hypothetical protein U9M48_037276 [Paspalum notatum var. saurae]|uniref:R13L1/DRL21-like LRR repeat region domain-containing protein n=1 Tax=Paspalum notatum var. saurae TaxID=547442 RepID=A0AAQ3UG34_PASNO